jgi:hypothetical protein
MEGACKKQKRVVLKMNAKTDICNRLKLGEKHKLIKQYGIGSSTIYDIRIIILLIIF